MAFVEYMMQRVRNSNVKKVPEFLSSWGYWCNKEDSTFIGWIDDDRTWYVPDSIKVLTKQQIINRQLLIHAHTPMIEDNDPHTESREMTEEEVIELISVWCDNFEANKNEPIEGIE